MAETSPAAFFRCCEDSQCYEKGVNMLYAKGAVENGRLVLKDEKVIDQSTLTADCWLVQFDGLKACETCELKGKRDCGGGETLKRLKRAARAAR